MSRYIIFGAGKNGRELAKHLGREKVLCFCDNNTELIGGQIDGFEVIDPYKLHTLKNYKVIISNNEASLIRNQLSEMGIDDYIIYISDEKKEQNNILSRYIENSDPNRHDNIEKYIKKIEQVDPIYNYNDFCELVRECKGDSIWEGWIGEYGMAAETLMYGHFDVFREYCNIKEMNPVLFPNIIHGAFYFSEPYYYIKKASIFSSPYFCKVMNKRFPYIPAFCVGPYISYIDGFVDSENDNDVLVFFEHSIECTDIEYNMAIVEERLLNNLSNKYSNITVCAYWKDIDSELYKKLNDNGVNIVSAGFRFDPRFIYRLRKIFSMYKNVVVCGRTTPIIYALCLNKIVTYYKDVGFPTSVEEGAAYMRTDRITSQLEEQNRKWEIILKKNAGLSFCEFSDEDKNILNSIFGISVKRTPNEIRKIYEISKDIWINCSYLENQYPIGVYKTYWDYQKKYEFDKLCILSDSLGQGFWNA